ncbi:MAG TPA: hypothetical protein VE863_15840, partial [Pyrinomonadaceae bacterium]|nr:hypothetical protein [Pyrinomonadaceae bacterium]
MKQKTQSRKQKAGSGRVHMKGRLLFFWLLPAAYCLLFFSVVPAQVGDYEGRPVSAVDVVIEGTPADPLAQSEFKGMLKIMAGSEYSAVNVRESLHALFASGR